MDPKKGLNKSGGGNPSKWSVPTPDSIKPEPQPAKPGGSGSVAGATKTANTPSGTHGMVSGLKSRY